MSIEKRFIFIRMEKKSYSHVLQKTGVLKNFTVAKIVKKKELEDLKKLIASVVSSEEEFKRILEEEMRKLSNMHDETNPIPGIIYAPSASDTKKTVYNLVKKFCKSLEGKNFSRRDLSFMVTAIITELGLTQADFAKRRDEIMESQSDEDGEEDEDEVDEDLPPEF